MLSLGGNHRVFLSRSPVDFRKAHDGLCSVIRDEFRDDPFAGDVFVFFNRAKDRIKLVVWDRNGFWLLYKRLEKGTFPFAVSGAERVEIEQGQLAMILEGIESSERYIVEGLLRARPGLPVTPTTTATGA